MKLSEAIRLGSMSSPQAFHAFQSGEARCAMGAALDAIGSVPVRVAGPLPGAFLRDTGTPSMVYAYYPIPLTWELLLAQSAVCPHCSKPAMLGRVIVHLNDDERWTRERIADWVETQEWPVPLVESQPTAVEIA